MRAELDARARIARLLGRQIEIQEEEVMKTTNKSALVAISVGLLLLMFSPLAHGGFYPVMLSAGLAVTVFGAFRVWRHGKRVG